MEAPELLSRLRVVRRDIPAHPELRTGVPNEHLAIEHPRRARNGVRPVTFTFEAVDAPQRFSVGRIQSHHTAVECGDDDFALPYREPAADNVTTSKAADYAGHLRVERPELLAGFRVV